MLPAPVVAATTAAPLVVAVAPVAAAPAVTVAPLATTVAAEEDVQVQLGPTKQLISLGAKLPALIIRLFAPQRKATGDGYVVFYPDAPAPQLPMSHTKYDGVR